MKMLHLNDVFKQDLDIWTKSPGLPWTSYGISTKGEIRDDPERVRQVRHFWHQVKLGDPYGFPDSCAFVRSHICDVGEAKCRAVWGYPATVTFGEAVFALPLIQAYRNLPNELKPIAYGYETFLGGAMRVRNRMGRNFRTNSYIGLDFTKFDKTVPAWLIRVAFQILSVNIDFTNYQEYGIANAENMYRMYHSIVEYFIKTPIRMATGRRFRKTSGIASGSYFTQLIGSICNCVVLYYTSLKLNGQLPQDSLFMGDDSFLISSKLWELEKVETLIAETFQMHINLKKSQISEHIDDMKFLGYQINHGRAKKETQDLIAALAFPESPDKEWDDLASRALGLYYANLGCNDDFSLLTWKIVKYRKFEIHFGRNFGRMLQHIGITIDDTQELPVPTHFLKNLYLNG